MYIKRPGTEFSIQETGNIPLSSSPSGSAEPRRKRFYCFLSVSERLSLYCLLNINVVHSRPLVEGMGLLPIIMFNLFTSCLHCIRYWMLISNLQYEPSLSSSSSHLSPVKVVIAGDEEACVSWSTSGWSTVASDSVSATSLCAVVSSCVDAAIRSHTQQCQWVG